MEQLERLDDARSDFTSLGAGHPVYPKKGLISGLLEKADAILLKSKLTSIVTPKLDLNRFIYVKMVHLYVNVSATLD